MYEDTDTERRRALAIKAIDEKLAALSADGEVADIYGDDGEDEFDLDTRSEDHIFLHD